MCNFSQKLHAQDWIRLPASPLRVRTPPVPSGTKRAFVTLYPEGSVRLLRLIRADVQGDTDFLCHENPSPEHLVQCFRDICATEVPDDGVHFDADSIVTGEIKKDAKYRGTRVVFNARIQNARVTLQFDVGFGDSVYPEAIVEEYPRGEKTDTPLCFMSTVGYFICSRGKPCICVYI